MTTMFGFLLWAYAGEESTVMTVSIASASGMVAGNCFNSFISFIDCPFNWGSGRSY